MLTIPQGGNVLFIILIAVALFAALSYAVSSSMRSGDNKALANEQLKSQVSAMLSVTSDLRGAVQRAAMLTGRPGDQLMYNNNAFRDRNGNAILPLGTPSNPNIYVFHPQGGGATPVTFENVGGDCTFSGCVTGGMAVYGHANFYYLNLPHVGTDAPDLVILYRALTNAFCYEINKALKIGPASGYIGLFVEEKLYQNSSTLIAPDPSQSPVGRPDAIYVQGKHEFCYRSVNSGGAGHAYTMNNFVSVLWAR